MTTHLKILSKSDIKFFEYPPEFSGEERKRFFSLPNWALEIVENIRIPINKVGFVLQLGYFKSVKRFFISKKFHTRDVDYVTRKLGYSSEQIDLVNYSKSTNGRHQEVIRESLGFRRFDEKSKKLLLEEAFSLCSNQMKPRLIFMSLVEFLPRKKIEIPNYHTFTEAITNALRQFEKNLLSSIQNQLNKEDKTLLNDLLKVSSQYLSIEKKESKIKRYNITILKNFYQSTKPSRIKENIKDFECLKSVFEKVEPILNQLNISPEIVRYYAQLAIKSQVFQLSRRDENRYLLLIAFVTHQFYKLNDVLVDILLQTCQTALNATIKGHKEMLYESRRSRYQLISELSNTFRENLVILKKIEGIVQGEELTDEQKVEAVREILLKEENQSHYDSVQEKIRLLDKESIRIHKDADYYDILESHSLKLQNRVSEIVKRLQFDKVTSNPITIEVIEYYKTKTTTLGNDVPLDFLEV